MFSKKADEESNIKNESISNKEKSISVDTSKRIRSLRFLLAILVIFKHNCYRLIFSSSYENIIFNQSKTGDWFQAFISDGIASCAVPLFFLFSAYLQAKKKDTYIVLIKKKFKSLCVPYIIWVVLYFLYFILSNNQLYDSCWWNFRSIFYFLIGFAETNGGAPLAASQFWFVRDLIIFSLFSPVLIWFIKKTRFLILLCIFILAESITIKYAAKSSMGLLFYILGLFWGLYDFDLFKFVDKIKYFEIIPIIFITFIFLNTKWPAANQLIMTIFTCIFMLKVSKNLIENESIYKKLSYLSNFSFFLYAIHMPVLLQTIQNIWLKIFPMKNTFFCLFEYFGVTILIVLIGTGLGILLKKICSPVFSLLNGGRK